MNEMKKSIKSWVPFLIAVVIVGLISIANGTTAMAATVVNPSPDNKYYTAYGPEPSRFTAASVPEEAANSRIDITDAFTLPGIYNGTNVYTKNNSYISNQRDNVLILYNGMAADQKSALWYNQKLNLNYAFEFEAYVFMGESGQTTPGVPDGLAFVLQRDPAYELAVGGRGGGLGVYPYAQGDTTMIYNALAVEMDTYLNTGNNIGTSLGYDNEIVNSLGGNALAWPHLAMATTATTGDLWQDVPGGQQAPINYVVANFKHHGVLTPSSAAEQNAWFNKWVKINISWTPNGKDGDYQNITTGNLSYTWGPILNNIQTELYPTYATQTWSNINIEDTFNSESFPNNNWSTEWTDEKRFVTWGFTGSNHYYGNPYGVMITKLPNEPLIEVDRKVKNTSVANEDYAAYTQSKPGDILEYKVKVENNSVDGTTIPIRNAVITEDLENNTWNNQFTYTSNLTSYSTPTPTMDGTNFTFTDGTNVIEPGDYFEYTYQVVVGDDTTEFINDVEIQSTYSSTNNFGETNVTVYPDGLNLVKAVSDNNPKVGDTVDVSLDLTAETGISILSRIQDSIPEGFELVPNSTALAVTDNTGAELGSETLADTLWSGDTTTGYNFSFSADTDLTNLTLIELLGGQADNNTFTLSYQIVVADSRKGQIDVSLGTATSTATNKVNGSRGTVNYTATSADVSVTVKTDITLNFLNDSGQALDATLIESSNASFDGINPVVLDVNTNDPYNYSTIISEISTNLMTSSNLSLYRVSTDGVDGSLSDILGTATEDGLVIDLYYGSRAVLTVEFVDETGAVMPGHTITIGAGSENTIQADIYIGDEINLTDPTYALVQEKVQDLKDAGYESITPPSNETAVDMTGAAVTVQYTVQGQLVISSYPKTIDFRSLTYNGQSQRVEDPDLSEKLTITDTRSGVQNGYVLKATLTAEMENDEGSVLGEAVRYVKGLSSDPSDEVILNDQAQEVYRAPTSGTGVFALSDTWSTTTQRTGIILVADPANAKLGANADPNARISDIGTFTGEITWSIEAIPEATP
ncbi:L-type lectin family protein [Enterococcus sp. LJL120]